MSTSTQEPPVQADPTTETTTPAPDRKQHKQLKAEQRQARIDVAAQKLQNTYRTADRKLPPAERRSEKQLWKDALRQAEKNERSQRLRQTAKDTARRSRDTAYAEAKSALHRNRAQLAPWCLAAPYAALGSGAWALAEYGSGHPVAISATLAATTTGAGIIAWRTWVAKKAPQAYMDRIRATIALLTAWATLMPLIPTVGQGGMWLSLIAATAYMALPWWRGHEHPLPAPVATTTAAAPAAVETPAAPDADEQFAQRILHDYTQNVATRGLLPGTVLSNPHRTPYGHAFRLQLAETGQTIDDARGLTQKIAYALNVDPASVLFDQDQRPGAEWRTLVMTIITEAPSNAYTGPNIVRDGGDIYIEVGPHSDGLDSAWFHVLSDQLTDEQLAAGEKPRGSMNGGFVFGTKGSGKSRFVELIATGLRALGVEIWYLDPQGGKSSPALMAEADWPMSGLHGDHAFSNVGELLDAVDAVCQVREAEGGDSEQGFQHTAARPAIMVIIDECHEVFQADDPESERNFGVKFAHLDRKMRKNGVGLFGASQSITQNTFGMGNDAGLLRSGMCAVNTFALAYRANPGLAPGYDDQPVRSLELNRGYGYNLMGERPHTRFQALYTPDFQPWLQHFPRPTLDQRAQKRIGKAYTQRFEKVAESAAAKQAWLDALDSSEDGSALPRLGTGSLGQAAPTKKPSSTSAPMLDLVSPAQQRQQASEDPVSAPSSAETTAQPTEAEQRVLDLLIQAPRASADVAEAMEVTPQTARKHLRNLTTKGLATADGGVYVAVDPDAG